VLASTAEALSEVLGDGAELLETRDAEAWAGAALSLLSEGAPERAARIARGRNRTTRYTWAATARQVWKIYREVAAS
jgi:glycosyltransferase involved in cell wall biosynthesis